MATLEELRTERLARLAIIQPIVDAYDIEIERLRQESRPYRRELYVITEREKYRQTHSPRDPKPKGPKVVPPSITPYTDDRKKNQRKTMTGRKHSPETIAKMSASHTHPLIPKAINTPYGEFESINSCASHVGMTPGSVHHKLRKQITGWTYLDRPSTISQRKVKLTRVVPVISPDNIRYETMTIASKATGISLYLIHKSITNNTGWTLA